MGARAISLASDLPSSGYAAYVAAVIVLAEIHEQFIGVVKKGRGTRLKEAPEMFSGLMWTGARSVELGLADGFGSVDYVAREIIKAADIVDYTQKENLAERFAKKLGAGVVGGLTGMSARQSSLVR